MGAEAARVAGALGCAALAALYLVPWRWARVAALAGWAAGATVLLVYLAPGGSPRLLAAAAVAAIVVAGGLGALFLRWPWLVPIAALACVPVRVPVDVGDERANLLVPLYGVVAGAAAALAWRLLRGDDRARELGALAWPLAAFLLWTGLSLLWTEDVREAAVSMLAFYLPFALLALVLARLPWSRRWLTALGVQLVAMALLFAGVGMYQWVTRDVFWNPKVEVGNAYAPFFRVNSVFWDPSIYGRFLVVAILAALVIVLCAPRPRVALGATAAIVLAWIGLALSFSQSSFVALTAGVLAAAAFAWPRRVATTVGAATAVLLLAGFSAPQVRHAVFEDVQGGLDRATSGRASLVANGVRIAADNPLAGVGLGSFRRAYADETGLRGEAPRRAASHNTPVTVAAETGVPGILLFVWLLAAALLVPLRRASRSFAGRSSLIVGVVLTAIAVHSLFYNAFFEDPVTWGVIGLGALVAAWRGGERRAAPA